MSELIDRQAAITLPVMPKEHREYQTHNLDDAYEQGWFDLQECIENLPSVQPEQRWIPCSERLPEIGQSVLLSVGGMYSAEGCLREDGDWAQFRWDAIQRKDMVGAWKPLPEPYKGEQECTKKI